MARGAGESSEHWEREDGRWSRARKPWRDWLILLIMVLAYLAWTGIVYAFEPGIR